MSNAPNLQKYLDLEQKGSIMAEYIWIDSDLAVRSKVRTLPYKEGGYVASELPQWNFDGQSHPISLYPLFSLWTKLD